MGISTVSSLAHKNRVTVGTGLCVVELTAWIDRFLIRMRT